MKTPTTQPHPRERRLLDLKATAALLGRSVYSVRELIWARQLPVVRTGRKIWVDIADIDRFIEENKTYL